MKVLVGAEILSIVRPPPNLESALILQQIRVSTNNVDPLTKIRQFAPIPITRHGRHTRFPRRRDTGPGHQRKAMIPRQRAQAGRLFCQFGIPWKLRLQLR